MLCRSICFPSSFRLIFSSGQQCPSPFHLIGGFARYFLFMWWDGYTYSMRQTAAQVATRRACSGGKGRIAVCQCFVSVAQHAGARRTCLAYQPLPVGSAAVQLGGPQQRNVSKWPRVQYTVKLPKVRFVRAPHLLRNWLVSVSVC